MVHGIGQRLQKANLVDDVGTFRLVTQNLADLHLTSYQRGTQRVLFIPCQVMIAFNGFNYSWLFQPIYLGLNFFH
ncbi:hypothetical protein Hanom_Chr03g00183051 [Helianthus anomalus]